MDAGHADIVNREHFVAHHLRGDLGLLSHRKVAGSGAHHGDLAFPAQGPIAPDAHGARGGEVFGLRMLAPQTFGCRSIGARHQDVLGFVEQTGDYGADLIGCFAFAKNDLRNPVPQGAMVIDLGEAQIFKRQVAHAFHGGVDIHRPGAHLFEQNA